MATILKRGNSYKITVSAGYDNDGKQIRQHMTWTPEPGLTPRLLEKELARQAVLFEESVNTGTVMDGNIKFADFTELWMKDFAKKQLKLKTYSEYEKQLLRINQAIGHIKLKDLRTGHLNVFYTNLEETGIRADKKYISKIDVLAAIKEKGITKTAFAEASKISMATLRSITSKKKINKVSAAAVSKALDKKISEVFKQENPEQLLSGSTIRTYHRLISSCLGKAVKWNYIPFNPAVNAQLPKVKPKEAAHLDEADARRLLELLHAEPIKYRAMISFDLLSGLRRGELLGLRWQDVDFEAETITICQTSSYASGHGVYIDTPKNKSSSRPLKLSRSTFLLLREYQDWQSAQRVACGDFWKDKDDRVFTDDVGAPVHPDALTKWFTAFVKRSGLPLVHIHSLRHTYASLMIADGTPLVVVSKRLGHAQVSTTANIYAHLIASADERASLVAEKFADVVASEPSEEAESKTTA